MSHPVTPPPPASIEAILTTGGAHTDSITVQGVIDTPLEEANTPTVLDRQQVKNLPDRPRTVIDALPLAPGIVRLPSGQLRLSGSGEHRSALLVNSATATDPATGQFGATVPIDSVRTMNVLTSPFLAEYGGFTADVVSVETRKGGDKWTFELNDPLPEFRWRSWHMVGLRSSTPRVSFGGPVIENRLFVLESIQYEMRETPVITLPFPNNESRREGYNSLTAIDYTINSSNLVTATAARGGSAHPLRQSRFLQSAARHPQYLRFHLFGRCHRARRVSRNAPRQRHLRHQFSRWRLAAGGPPHDPDTVAQSEATTSASRPVPPPASNGAKPGRSRSKLWGTHNLKFGSVLGGTTEHALINEHPVNIFDSSRRADRKHRIHARAPHRPNGRGIGLFRAGSVGIQLARLSQLRPSRRTAGSHRRFPARPARRARRHAVRQRPHHRQGGQRSLLRPRSVERLRLRALPRSDHHHLQPRWNGTERPRTGTSI